MFIKPDPIGYEKPAVAPGVRVVMATNSIPGVENVSDIRIGLARWQPAMLSLLRLVAGLVFLEHGTAKLLGFPHNPAYDHLELFTLEGASGACELIGGFLVAIGLFTRSAAFLVSGEMAVGYFVAHAPRNFFPLLNGGDAAILFCFLFLYLVFAGPGPGSVDGLLASRNWDRI